MCLNLFSVWNSFSSCDTNNYLHINNLLTFFYWIYIFPNPSARAGYDTRSIFKWSLTGSFIEYKFILNYNNFIEYKFILNYNNFIEYKFILNYNNIMYYNNTTRVINVYLKQDFLLSLNVYGIHDKKFI